MVSPQGSLYTNSEHAPTQLTPHEELVASMHGSDPDELLEYYESEETIQNLSDAYYQDSDGDGIPDIHDTQETQYVTIAGDEVFVSDDIKDFVDDVNTSVARTLRSNIGGYGGGGGSQPINRVFNTPGNVASFLGHALRIAGHAHQDVLNGIPTFSIPSKCDATSYVPKDYPGG